MSALQNIAHSITSLKQKSLRSSSGELDENSLDSQLRYHRIFQTAQNGILILDAHTGKIIDINPFLTKLLGYTRTELIDKNLSEICVLKDVIDSKTARLHFQENGYIRYNDLSLKTKKGLHIHAEFIGNVYVVDHEKVILCNIQDITDRKKAEEIANTRTKELEKLNKSQEKIRKAMLNVMEDLEVTKSILEQEKAKDEAILASIGEGLFAIDNNRKIIIMNLAAEKLLGWKKKELIGNEVTDLFLEDEEGHPIPLNKRPTYLALTTGKLISITHYILKKDKTRFPIAINVTPIKLNKKVVGAVVIFRDITQEKEIDKAKSEFVSLASHQLRAPLGVIKWYLEALQNEKYIRKAPVIIREYFDEICKNNERILSLVRDLLSVSRIDQRKVKNIARSSDLVKITQEIVEQMQITAHKKKIKLRFLIKKGKIPSICIDPLRFHEVVENLVGNSVEYTLPSGTVDVSMYIANHSLYIRVKDTGIGISKQDQGKLFTKFFRSTKAIQHNPEGSGLGLYVVKSYVKDWGGNIIVESAEGKGSTFTVRLPCPQKRKKGGVS